MRRRGRAFALAYTLLVSAVVLLFASALFVRATESLRLSANDVSAVRATALADTGAQLAFSLLKDHDPRYFDTLNPLRSTNLGANFAPSVIGGTFEVTVDDTDYAGLGLYPQAGTFYVIQSVGRVGNRSATTSLTVKMTNPLLNYLILSPRDVTLSGSRTVVGPITVNADPASGDNGNLRFCHENEQWSSIISDWYHDAYDLRLDVQARASGGIFIQNSCGHGLTLPALNFNGRYPAGSSQQHQDFAIWAPGASWAGRVSFIDEFTAEANVKFDTKVPPMTDLLKKFRAAGGPPSIDISGYANGVMVEFVGDTVYLSEAQTRQIGTCYDRDVGRLVESDMTDDLYQRFFRVPLATATQMFWNDVVWDDPRFEPNRPYPIDPTNWPNTDLNGDGTADATGDAVDVFRLERGPTFQSFTLSDTAWTTLYLRTNRTDYLDGRGNRQGPPVYLRGIVNGKCMVVYDVTSDALDPNSDRLHMAILGQHEDPQDSLANKLPVPGGAPGVVGGLLYEDRVIKSDPDQPTSTSDRVFLMCRGTLTGVGNPGAMYENIYDLAGAPFNYAQQTRALDNQYSQAYTGAAGDNNFKARGDSWDDGPNANLYGVGVACHTDGDDVTLDSLGRISSDPGWASYWEDIPAAVPPGYSANQYAFFPYAFELASRYADYDGTLRGAFHSLESSVDLQGNAYYDYNWQALEEQEIRQEMQLPVSPVLINWLRR